MIATCPAVPRTTIDTTRPPHSPYPLREVTMIWVSAPIVGNAACTVLIGRLTRQL